MVGPIISSIISVNNPPQAWRCVMGTCSLDMCILWVAFLEIAFFLVLLLFWALLINCFLGSSHQYSGPWKAYHYNKVFIESVWSASWVGLCCFRGKSKWLTLCLTGLIHPSPKAEVFSVGNHTQTCSISLVWHQAGQGVPRGWDSEGPKDVGGTVVKEASCQGDQYLFSGQLSAFQTKSVSDLYCAVNDTLVGVS